MKILKKNQVIIYSIALMLIVAGYLNYTNTNGLNTAITTSSSEEEKLASENNIGDAELVNANTVDINSDSNTFNINSNNNSEIKNNNTENNSNNNDNKNNNIENNINKNSNITLSSISSKSEESSNQSSNSINNQKSNNDYFTASKLERDSMYSQMIETYENILNSNNISETQKQSAQEEITKINNIKNKIMICENLIKTKGFSNSVVFVNDNSVSVIVQANELKSEKVAQIQNIISRELNAKIENIHISNK